MYNKLTFKLLKFVHEIASQLNPIERRFDKLYPVTTRWAYQTSCVYNYYELYNAGVTPTWLVQLALPISE